MMAVNATFAGFPAVIIACYLVLKFGLKRVATSAGI